MGNLLTCIDLFSGAGGLSEGFKQAGFTILAANDFDECSAATMKIAHPGVEFLSGPIQNIASDRLLSISGLSFGELDCLVGGPPCQAYSVYNHQRGMHDERSGLFREYLRIVKDLKPRFVVMENVTGITSVGEGRAVKEITERLDELGYKVEFRILKAEHYGVPQERRRIFFVGYGKDFNFCWPSPTHRELDLGRKNLAFGFDENISFPTTVWTAISDLPSLDANKGYEIQDYQTLPQNDYQKPIREGSPKIFNHVAPHLAPINLERLKYIPQGGSWRDIPVELLPAGMKKARRSDHTKRYGRLHPNGLACTILTKCDPHWGAFFHPFQDRAITVREAARLQSFPDRFQFQGSRVDQYRQVGNAVPPLLARAVASSVAQSLSR